MTLTDPELLDYSAKHLQYELFMLWAASELLKKPTGGSNQAESAVLRFALIEAFGLHLRNVIDFLYLKTTREDDVLAVHFLHRDHLETIPPILKEARDRANKELHHLTTERKDDDHPDKPWRHEELINELRVPLRRFVTTASTSRLHCGVRQFVLMNF